MYHSPLVSTHNLPTNIFIKDDKQPSESSSDILHWRRQKFQKYCLPALSSSLRGQAACNFIIIILYHKKLGGALLREYFKPWPFDCFAHCTAQSPTSPLNGKSQQLWTFDRLTACLEPERAKMRNRQPALLVIFSANCDIWLSDRKLGQPLNTDKNTHTFAQRRKHTKQIQKWK